MPWDVLPDALLAKLCICHHCLHLPTAHRAAAVYLVEVEDQVQLTHIAEVVVKDLHKQVDRLQRCQLIV